MAYTKQNWECGDLITADKMNHIEDGIEEASSGGGALVVTMTPRNATAEECSDGGHVYEFSHSWQQMHDVIATGGQVWLRILTESVDAYEAVLVCSSRSGAYRIVTRTNPGEYVFTSPTSTKSVVCSVL